MEINLCLNLTDFDKNQEIALNTLIPLTISFLKDKKKWHFDINNKSF